jgi:hypothetical protein
MTGLEALILAMAGAAAAQFRPNAFVQERPEVEAYLGLRRLLAERHPAVSNDILDIGPASVERQSLLREQLREAKVDSDTIILRQTTQLLRLLEHVPNAATAVRGTPEQLVEALAILNGLSESSTHERRDHP